MISPFYRPSSGASSGGGGGGVSEAGGKGALTLFGGAAAATEVATPFIPSHANEAAAAQAAADAYASTKTGLAAGKDVLLQGAGAGQLEIPQLQLGDTQIADAGALDIGKAINDMIAGMGDLINQAIASPMGFLTSLLGFLFKLFTDIASSTVQMLNDIAKAAASAIEEATRKQLEAVQNSAQNLGSAGLQPLELFNQAASTQALSTALKSISST